jgi:hypothetical protein
MALVALDSKTRPLLARPGAVFRCSGNGLCCTDIHELGLLTRSEVKELRQRNKLAVVYSDEIGGFALRPVEHRCLYLRPDELCGLHANHGAAAKPCGCRRFPYGLVTTPYGGRVTTEHRCPCRTIGPRPPISLEDAHRSLLDRAGRLEVDRDAPVRVELSRGKRVDFSVYTALEARMIEQLNQGVRAERVLAAKPLPELSRGGWPSIAIDHIETLDSTAGGLAFAWFGDALLQLATGHKPPKRARPWAVAFERAIAATPEPQDPETIFNDWIADEIWMFRWVDFGPFDVARAELATRLRMARLIQRRIMRLGVRADQAAAEAVMMCELASGGLEWPEAVSGIARKPSPAEPLQLPG